MKEEYEESDYEKTRHKIESSSTSIGDPQGKEFTIDNENESIKIDGVIPIMRKDMIYKKIIFQSKSEYICEMVEWDLEINDSQYDMGEVNLVN